MSSALWRCIVPLVLTYNLAFAQETCDLEFNAVTISTQPSLLASQTHEVWVKSLDGTKPEDTIVAGCTLNYFGKGCTWQRDGRSEIAGYTIEHGRYTAFFSNPTTVNVTGNGCDGTKLLCKGVPVTVTPIDDPDSGAVSYIYTAQTICRLTRPEGAESTPTVAQLVETYNNGQLIHVSPPEDTSETPTTVSPSTPIPTLTCSYQSGNDCYDPHWMCDDGVAKVAYPTDAPVKVYMTEPLDASPTLLANKCPDSSNPPSSDRECSVAVGVFVNRVENEKPYITMQMYNENAVETGSWGAEMDVGETQSVGSLGPLVSLTLKASPAPEEWPVDLDMAYDGESWNWMGCEFMSTSDLGRDQWQESRKCDFPCRG